MGLHLTDAFARRHHGLITLAEVRQQKLSKMTWYRAIHDGRVVPVHPGVARLASWPESREQRILAAVLACGEGVMASHRSSVHLWGAERPDDDPVDVIIPTRDRRSKDLAGVVVHRPRDYRDLRPMNRSGIPTSSLLRTLCDLPVVDADGLDAALGHFITAGTVSPSAIYSAIRTHSRRGRPGVPRLRAGLEAWLIDGKPMDSELERRMLELSGNINSLPRRSTPDCSATKSTSGSPRPTWCSSATDSSTTTSARTRSTETVTVERI